MKVTPMVAGITRPATSDVPKSRKKRTMMQDARINPRRIASRTLLIDSFTSSD